MSQDSWLADILTSSPTVSTAGDTLTMQSGGYQLSFLDRRAAIPDAPLEGTRWVLAGLGRAPAMTAPSQACRMGCAQPW